MNMLLKQTLDTFEASDLTFVVWRGLFLFPSDLCGWNPPSASMNGWMAGYVNLSKALKKFATLSSMTEIMEGLVGLWYYRNCHSFKGISEPGSSWRLLLSYLRQWPGNCPWPSDIIGVPGLRLSKMDWTFPMSARKTNPDLLAFIL